MLLYYLHYNLFKFKIFSVEFNADEYEYGHLKNIDELQSFENIEFKITLIILRDTNIFRKNYYKLIYILK